MLYSCLSDDLAQSWKKCHAIRQKKPMYQKNNITFLFENSVIMTVFFKMGEKCQKNRLLC